MAAPREPPRSRSPRETDREDNEKENERRGERGEGWGERARNGNEGQRMYICNESFIDVVVVAG